MLQESARQAATPTGSVRTALLLEQVAPRTSAQEGVAWVRGHAAVPLGVVRPWSSTPKAPTREKTLEEALKNILLVWIGPSPGRRS